MLTKIISIIILISFINFILGCSTTGTVSTNKVTATSLSNKINAKKLPEVRVTVTSKEFHNGKILGLEAEKLILLPFPYWNVSSIEIYLDEIHSIKLLKKDSKAGKGFGCGFALIFLITGIFGGLNSEYDEDYEGALRGGIVIGLFGGLLGLIIGGISSIAQTSQYDFYKMSNAEKIKSIKKIMDLNE